MDNEFGYLDDKPFEECYKDKQIMSLINTDEKGIEFKVIGNNKFSIFDIRKSLKEIYAIDSKFCPITAFRVNIINSKLTAISSSTLRSDLYFYKQGFQEENRKIKHFTSQTKIYKIEYYNDSISRVFGNSSFDIDLKRVQKNDKYVLKTVNIKADKKKEQKICNIKIVDNNISVFLKENFEYLHNYRNSERISINDNSCIIVKFQKGINFDKAYKYILLLDSLFYLMTLLKRRHKKVFVYDFRKNKYLCRDMKMEEVGNEVRDRNFLICKRQESVDTFDKMFKTLYILEKDSKNALFPFWEFDIKQTSLEIKFLEYYKILEYLDYEKRKKLGKGKNKTFLKEFLNENKDLKERFFGTQDITEIEEEIRALRNYYSHEGYYVHKLPIPTDKPRRYKNIEPDWLYNVLNFIKIASYMEIYKFCGLKIDWKNLVYNI